VPDPWEALPLTDLSYQILLALAGTTLHGYAILQTISRRTGGRLEPESGTLYTAVRRLRRDGLIDVEEEPTEGRRGRRYGLTKLGREVLELESRRLRGLVEEARRKSLLDPEPTGGHG
jgi:PadR family transcriptional regulator PadR